MPKATGADRSFLEALRNKRAGLMVNEIAAALGVTESAVRARAARLRERWLIDTNRTGGFTFYSLSVYGKKAIR